MTRVTHDDRRASSAAEAVAALRHLADPERARALQGYFKTGEGEYGEGDRFLGLTVPTLRRLARSFQTLPLSDLRALLESEWHEARLLALLILVRQYQRGPADERSRIFRAYLSHRARVNNWDLVDQSAPGIVGAHLAGRPRSLLDRLARSKSVWDRRIAIISTAWFIRLGEFDDTLRIAAALVGDRHDLIHKAVGWMLREVGLRDRAVEERFLDRHAPTMPRTMLRYAVEKFPEPLRQKYLKMGRSRKTSSRRG